MTTPQSRLLKLADEAVADYNAMHAAGGEAVYPSWVEDVRLLCNATIPAGWLPIESAPKDGRRVLLWNERYNAAITGQFYGLGGWKLDGEMPPLFHQPTHWMPLPAAPGVSTVENERQGFEAWAKKKKMPLARIGQQYDDFWVDHAWNGWQARASVASPAVGDALALLDHPLLRDVLGYIEDAGPAVVWRAAQAWMELRDAAQRHGDA